MPKLYVLVGVPGSGKTTWVNNQDWAHQCTCVGTDTYVEAYARSVGKTYSDVFEEFMPQAVKLMLKDVMAAKAMNADIIWDQTSTTQASRLKKFNLLPDYYKIAVVFRVPSDLDQRLAARPGKIIPEDVVKTMIDNFEEPTTGEGFDEIWYAV